MQFKKPSKVQVKDTIALTGGLVGGSMLSKAVFGFMHEATTATDAASLKKDENTQLVKRGVLVAAGVAGAMFINGNDSLTTAVKGASAGVAVIQALEVIKVLANRSGVESEATASSAAKKAVARAVGLGCACNQLPGSLNAPVDFAPRYDLSNMDYYAPTGQLNGWSQLAEETGLQGWGSLQQLTA
ncbi:hypothetical protein AMR72_16350 [Flavobacterium psychrophilum]|nr:hypothetical protein AMR72_16350 [Flavobacterium psychrophilum]AOE53936.1 hypothetical protein ALW18_16340 [Flavobacterium psychrophilum]